MENFTEISLDISDEPMGVFFYSCDGCNPDNDYELLKKALLGDKVGTFVGTIDNAYQAGWQSREDGDFCPTCVARDAATEAADAGPDMQIAIAAETALEEPPTKIHLDEAPEVREYREEMAAQGKVVDVKNVRIPAKAPTPMLTGVPDPGLKKSDAPPLKRLAGLFKK